MDNEHLDIVLDDNDIILRNMILLLNKKNKDAAVELYQYIDRNSKLGNNNHDVKKMLLSDKDFAYKILRQFNIDESNKSYRYCATVLLLVTIMTFMTVSFLKGIWIMSIIGMIIMIFYLRKN